MNLPANTYEKAVLTATLGSSDVAAKAWNSLAYQVPPWGWPEPWRRLLPVIWKNIENVAPGVPVYRQFLAQSYRDTWASNAHLAGVLTELLEILKNAGIPALLLKGLWLNLTVYGELGTRPAGDIDLLVPFQSAQVAIEALRGAGWESIGEDFVKPAERLYHAIGLERDDVHLDLHWFLLPEARRPGCDDVFWRAKQSVVWQGHEIWGLSNDHLFLHLLVLAEREPYQRVRYFHDLYRFWSMFGDKVCIDTVVSLLKERNLLTRALPLIDGLRKGRDKLGTPTCFDRLWSRSTQTVFDEQHEFYYGIYPFLDFYLHRQGAEAGETWNFSWYLRRRLRLQGPEDLIRRTFLKLYRTITGSVP